MAHTWIRESPRYDPGGVPDTDRQTGDGGGTRETEDLPGLERALGEEVGSEDVSEPPRCLNQDPQAFLPLVKALSMYG